MTRLVDLDDSVGLERAWAELERVHAVRAIDPDLYENIRRRCELLDDPADAEPILRDLDQLHPALVAEIHFDTLVKVVGRRHPLGRAGRS